MSMVVYEQKMNAGQPGSGGSTGREFVDVHCHCLCGLDDGPATMAESLRLCKMLVADGILTVVATPHQMGRFDGCYQAGQIRDAVAILNGALERQGIALTVLPGADVRIDERICELLRSDKILTLADGGRYILLELPHETFIDPEPLLASLSELGLRPVISHPERNAFLSQNPALVFGWAEYGIAIQLTAASLAGDLGRAVQESAWRFIDMPLPVMVATDSHNCNKRAPRMRRAFDSIARRRGMERANLLCIKNPRRVLSGEDLLVIDGKAAQEAHKK